MDLWLDGNHWSNWIRKVCIPEIEWTRRAILEHMLPSIPDPATEADKTSDAIYYGDTEHFSFEEDMCSLAEYAENQGMEVYDRLNSVRQASANMATVMLWHLLEQQMLVFHKRQVLTMREEKAALQNPEVKIEIPCKKGKEVTERKLLSLEEFHARLGAGGCSMTSLPAWKKVKELHLIANTVKHGSGSSAKKLYKIRPDLFYPNCNIQEHNSRPCLLRKPAAGEDLYVTEQDIAAYFEAAISLWQEFSIQIEEHSQKRDRSQFS
jgi:hypothetical protein